MVDSQYELFWKQKTAAAARTAADRVEYSNQPASGKGCLITLVDLFNIFKLNLRTDEIIFLKREFFSRHQSK